VSYGVIYKYKDKGGEKEMSASIRIKKGKYQVVEVTYNNKGVSTINVISDWIPIPQAVKDMKHMPANIDFVAGTQYEHYFK
jgi:uncharacterized protein YxeA